MEESNPFPPTLVEAKGGMSPLSFEGFADINPAARADRDDIHPCSALLSAHCVVYKETDRVGAAIGS